MAETPVLVAVSYTHLDVYKRQDHDHGDHHDHDWHHHHHPKYDVNRHDERIRAVCLTLDQPVSRLLFDQWLDILMQIKGPDLLRVKGIVHIADLAGPLVIHGVQHIFHPPLLGTPHNHQNIPPPHTFDQWKNG